jgi:cob(I)alamin adenosyltransferase
MVRLTSITTRGGDTGQTSLADGTRVSKADARIVAQGSVDELNACIGLAVAVCTGDAADLLRCIQNDLFDLGADITIPEAVKTEASLRVSAAHITVLEEHVALINERLDPLTSFVLPGGTVAAAHLHMGRTIARRAEREVWALADSTEINPLIGQYLNRLSDLLFVMARDANDGGKSDVLWVPGASSSS